MHLLIWIGIVFCVSQSAMFSGLNLAFFSISKLRLEVEASRNNPDAVTVSKMRRDANFLLTTILWGNVGVNVLLTLLSNSVMTGVVAFVFSTFVITFLGEIFPQAYFSRHALKVAALLSPLLRFYQGALYPLAKPTAWVLDRWLGPEGIRFFREKDLREILKMHINAEETGIERFEGRGAINFLDIDERLLKNEGRPIEPASVLTLDFSGDQPIFPSFSSSPSDPFIQKLLSSGKKWVILTDPAGEPRLALNTDNFLSSLIFDSAAFQPLGHCHRPILIRNDDARIGDVIGCLEVHPDPSDSHVIDNDIIVFWGSERRVITGADILGSLLRGIAGNQHACFYKWDSPL